MKKNAKKIKTVYTTVMANTLFHTITSNMRFQRSTLIFVILTIILHFLFFQSSVLTKWSSDNKQTPDLEQNKVQVSIRTLASAQSTNTATTKEIKPKAEPKKSLKKTPNNTLKKIRQHNSLKALNAEMGSHSLNNKIIAMDDIDLDFLVLDTKSNSNSNSNSDSNSNSNSNSESKTQTTTSTTLLPDAEKKAEELSLLILESADIEVAIERVMVNGNSQQGVGKITWRANTNANSYSLKIEAGLSMLVTTLNLYKITSEGNLGTYGLSPIITTESRLARAATATHFNYEQNIVSFSASTKKIPMEIGVQDKASVLMQLAAIGNADSQQLTIGKELSVQVAEEKEASIFQFTVVGEEEILSPLARETGKLNTIHLVRPPKPGSYNSQLDIWFAPSLGWYPIQIRNTESNGTITTQKVRQLQKIIH